MAEEYAAEHGLLALRQLLIPALALTETDRHKGARAAERALRVRRHAQDPRGCCPSATSSRRRRTCASCRRATKPTSWPVRCSPGCCPARSCSRPRAWPPRSSAPGARSCARLLHLGGAARMPRAMPASWAAGKQFSRASLAWRCGPAKAARQVKPRLLDARRRRRASVTGRSGARAPAWSFPWKRVRGRPARLRQRLAAEEPKFSSGNGSRCDDAVVPIVGETARGSWRPSATGCRRPTAAARWCARRSANSSDGKRRYDLILWRKPDGQTVDICFDVTTVFEDTIREIEARRRSVAIRIIRLGSPRARRGPASRHRAPAAARRAQGRLRAAELLRRVAARSRAQPELGHPGAEDVVGGFPEATAAR